MKIKVRLGLREVLLIINIINYTLGAILLKENKITPTHKKLCVDSELKLTKYEENFKDLIVACATYYDSEGWHILTVKSQENNHTNLIKAFSAGLLEGYIYHDLVDFHYTNIFSTIMNKTHFTNRTLEFVNDQYKYVEDLVKYLEVDKKHIEENFLSNDDIEYLETLELILEQYKGLYRGYKLASIESQKDEKLILTEKDFYLLTMQADLEDILIAYESERFGNGIWKKDKDCSGFVKYVESTNNLIVGHNTHNHYSLMNRIFKNYELNLVLSTGKLLNNFKYSSRPGDLNSKDDYYVLSNNMVVIETSLEVVDLSIYKNLMYHTIPKWIRVNIANKLATNNNEWIELFFKENSGTHNNQWLIVDYKKFEEFVERSRTFKDEKKSIIHKLFKKIEYLFNYKSNNEEIIPKDVIHIVEQTPNLSKRFYKDMSEDLINKSYVASYNAPFFEEVIREIGYTNPPYSEHDYLHARRNFLFNILQSKVTDIDSAKDVLRFHSKEDICDTIGARCDMVNKVPFGAVDAKLTDRMLMKNNQSSMIIYGPPYIPGVSEPFDFKDYPDIPHLGIPEKIEFDWIYA